ncbi:MAG TPA: 4-hydroxy-tetrahydrodipicolinate synthase [Streptosporangiaceae bacterium]|jgi:4-hydroxy-tetrahydrodipicolinate synthase
MPPRTAPDAPFGRMLTAMITPMNADGSMDYDGAARLAAHLVDEMRNDGLVINGTTGESPTTSPDENQRLLKSVLDAVGDRASVVMGVGSNDTAHAIANARAAEGIGAHGALVVTPYYNKPPQEGLLRHFTMVADAAGLPVMLYDIPGRTGTAIATETLLRLAEHPRILAVKDAKSDLGATSRVINESDLVVYSGEDMLNLPLLSIGAAGFVSVVGHVVGARLAEMIEAYRAGDVARAARIHRDVLPVYLSNSRTQGVMFVKAVLNLLGLPAGPVRPPLVDAPADLVAQIRDDLAGTDVKLPEGTHA